MKKIEELEKELEEKFQDFKSEYKSYQKTHQEIEPRLEKKKAPLKSQKKFPIIKTIIAVAACLLLLITGGLAYFLLQTDDTPVLRYEDTDVPVNECQESFFKAETIDLYLPNLSVLSEKSFWIATHNISHENVYFTVNGIVDDGVALREIKITIILKEEYHPTNEANYQNLEHTFKVDDKTIIYTAVESEFPFISYYVAFTTNNIRYYINYKTIDEGDIETFFTEFLK